ncbi:FMRFamide receptor isoform X1 [Lepeophtheirus salmonis]|uniref:FMRFamide receptor isoform X1 n=1 Tax=Lepeophtheirus salmonis TaxID=72036 RepID=UPI001AE2ADBC|nr:FMRFamide receptor-like isoform X1 [Lepeophtheirus salmonis]
MMNKTLDCPEFTENHEYILEKLTFWIEGVVQCVIGFGGLCGNFLSAYILSRDEMQNSFNLLLIALLTFDSWYLFGGILESFRRQFDMGTELHTLLFPYFLYPAQSIAMSASIFMTVAIAWERYIAVHYPIDYNQSNGCPKAIRRRLIKYLVPVLLISIIFNIPKFLEARIVYGFPKIMDGNNTTTQHLKSIPMIRVTELRKNPNYAIYYNNWTRLAILGIIPACMLIYLNYKIYKDIKQRQIRRRQSTSQVTINHQARRRQEDNLAVVFMGIVGVFLLCHILRIFINLHEMLVIRPAMECREAKLPAFPFWVLVTTVFSHLLLVFNSSTNMIIYCSLNATFRRHFVEILRRCCFSWSIFKRSSNYDGDATNNSIQMTEVDHHGSDNKINQSSHNSNNKKIGKKRKKLCGLSMNTAI